MVTELSGKRKKRFQARIKVDGKSFFLGNFVTWNAAHKIELKAQEKVHQMMHTGHGFRFCGQDFRPKATDAKPGQRRSGAARAGNPANQPSPGIPST